jgi:SAM-dependent methyltransferase
VGSRYSDLGRLQRYFERRWRRAGGEAPWGDTRACPIERAKAALFEPHFGDVRSVLDLGCGGGDFLSMVAPRDGFERAVGLDCAEGAVARARRSGLYHEVHQAFLEDAPRLVTGEFDLVLFSEVLYYVPDPLAAVAMAVDRYVGPRGRVALALAVGRDYFHDDDIERTRALLGRKRFLPVVDEVVDYRALGIPRRLFGPLYGQSHKAVMVWARRPLAGVPARPTSG